MDNNTPLYFAYGSNLNPLDWKHWCHRAGHNPDSIRPLFSAWLPDHFVRFGYLSNSRRGGVLDIFRSTGYTVPGVVFQVSREGWAALDKKEGAPRAYRRIARQCLTLDGQVHKIQTYQVNSNLRERFVKPSEDYLGVVREGLEQHELPSAHFEAAADDLRPEPLDAVFVYGSLMRGESRHHLMASLHCVLLAEAVGKLFDCGEYPAMSLAGSQETCGFVQGEFARLRNAGLLRELDAIECFAGFGEPGSLFRRALIEVGMHDGRLRQAWTYVSAAECGSREIRSGDWREHRGRKTNFLQKLAALHCMNGENAVAKALLNRHPFPPENEDAEVAALLPIDVALSRGKISERELAQVSGMWNANPC